MFHFYFLCTKDGYLVHIQFIQWYKLFSELGMLQYWYQLKRTMHQDSKFKKYGIIKENITQIKVYKILVFDQISIVCVYHKRHGCAIVLNSKWLMEKFSIFRISLLRKIGIDENKHVWFCVCNVKSLNTNINEKISCPRDMNCQYIKKKIWFETKLYHPNRIVIHAIINESYTPLCMVTWNKSFFF